MWEAGASTTLALALGSTQLALGCTQLALGCTQAGPGVYIEQQAASVVGRVSNQASARKGQVVGPSRLRTLRLTLR